MQNVKMSVCLRTSVDLMEKWIFKDVEAEKRPMICAEINAY